MGKILVSKASRNSNGPRQLYAPDPFIVVTSVGTNDKPAATPRILIPTPDSRCRVKFSLLFVSPAGTPAPNLVPLGNTLWLAACEEDTRGGGGGRVVPVTDIEGTSATPIVIPKSTGLLGYSREVVTSADWLQATCVLVTSTNVGAWVVQTQIQPEGVVLPWEEWEQIVSEFRPFSPDAKAIV